MRGSVSSLDVCVDVFHIRRRAIRTGRLPQSEITNNLGTFQMREWAILSGSELDRGCYGRTR